MVKLRRTRWLGLVTRLRKIIYENKVLAGKSEGKRPLGRLRRR
jgi:hypothetical protein